jgi:lysophospholipase L1-like esterase
LVLVLGGLEGLARLFVPAPPTLMGEARTAITAQGLPALAPLLDPDPALFWRLKPDLLRVPVAGRIGSYPIRFNVSTDSRGFRAGAVSPAPGARRLLVLGDSASFGLGVEDAEAWPAKLGGLLAQEGAPPGWEIINAAVPGYTAYQGLQFLKTRGDALRPGMVVAEFWANDKADWSSRSDMEHADMMRRQALLLNSRLAWAMNRFRARFSDAEEKKPAGRSRLSEKEFTDTLAAIAAWGRERGVPVMFLVWPSRRQVEERQDKLYGYQELVAQTAKQSGALLADPAPAFIAAGGDLFVDEFHGSARGCALAAEAVRGVLETPAGGPTPAR